MKIFVWFLAIVGVASLIFGVCSQTAPSCCSRKASNERNASASLKTVAAAQADFRNHDRDGNGVRDYWRGDVAGLYGVLSPGDPEMIKLIEFSVAAADVAPLDPAPGHVARDEYAAFAPKADYVYRALRHDDEDPDALDPHRFAACAVPVGYPKLGRWTYILSEGGTIYRRDLGGRAPDVFPDAETLKREWLTLD